MPASVVSVAVSVGYFMCSNSYVHFFAQLLLLIPLHMFLELLSMSPNMLLFVFLL